MKNIPRRTHFDVGFYALAFLDLLNQKNLLDKMTVLPSTDTEKEKYIELLKETVGSIDNFRNAFDTFFKAKKEGQAISVHSKKLNEEQKKIMDKYLHTEIKPQYFSDTVIFYTPLSDDSMAMPISDVYDLLSMTSVVFLITLSAGIVSRGSIVVGVGTNYFKNEIYGPALRNAYKLESEIAQYPRIVIDGNLVDKIKEELSLEANGFENNLRRNLAEKCFNYIRRDLDGVMILDYLGEEVKKYEMDFTPIVKEARGFIKRSLAKFYSENNYKLIKRYLWLDNYFNDRINEHWAEKM